MIDHELTFSICLDDVWYKLFSLGAYILGNWKVDTESRTKIKLMFFSRLVYIGMKKEDTKEEI